LKGIARMTNYIAATDLSAFAPELDTSQYSAATLSGIIGRATAQVNNYCNVKGFEVGIEVAETDRATINSDGELVIAVRRPNIISVSAIRLKQGTYSNDLTLTSNGNPIYQIPHPGSRLHYPNSYIDTSGTLITAGSRILAIRGANLFYEIDYTGGYVTIPDDIKEATTLLVRDIIATRNNQDGVDSFAQGSYSVQFGNNKMGESKLVRAAKSILDPYVERWV
jgi:hypothetical protein